MIDLPVPVVLASASRARRELLATMVATFDVVAAGVDEEAGAGLGPREAALSLAEAKVRAVAARRPEALVIGADTIVLSSGEVLGKPRDREDARRMLWQLTRRPHSVITGLFVLAPDGRSRSACVETGIRMRRMAPEEVESYTAHPDVMYWAGAYALQADDPNVEALEGSETSVMGLPVEALKDMLADLYPERTGR
jgi:septum formation protein